MRTHYFTWINAVMIGLSIGCWLPALWGFSSIEPLQRTLTDMVELGPHLFKTPAFWLGVVILAPVMALLLDLILSSWQRQRHPLDRQIFQVENVQLLVQATAWHRGVPNVQLRLLLPRRMLQQAHVSLSFFCIALAFMAPYSLNSGCFQCSWCLSIGP